ncbi:MAG: DUF3786 domain-containing protein [Eggerthellaceae bacterium]|nr:DUF3786 domain-containing protein [Eggerthellaceae bacterium]
MDDSKDFIASQREEHMGQQYGAPLAHYQDEFASADPTALSARSGVPYDDATAQFSLRLLGRATRVSWPTLDVIDVETESAQSTKVRILLACLLLHGKLVPSAGKFKAYNEIPWGDHYYKAFEGRCIKRLAGQFGYNLAAFDAKCSRLGMTQLKGADSCWEVEIVDGVYMRLALWEADDEFPTSAQITFSDNAELAFSAEELAVVGDVVMSALSKA